MPYPRIYRPINGWSSSKLGRLHERRGGESKDLGYEPLDGHYDLSFIVIRHDCHGIPALTLYAGLYVGCDPQLRLAVLAGAKLLECPQSPVARMPERFICTLAVLSASRWRVCRHVKVAWSYRPGGGDELRLVVGVESSAQRPHRSASCSHCVAASLPPLPYLLVRPVIRQAPY